MTNTLTGIIRDGRVELDLPVALPNGTRVRIQPEFEENDCDEQHPWPTTMEGIEAMIEELRAIEPAVLIPEEEATIIANRKAMKAESIKAMHKRMGLNQ